MPKKKQRSGDTFDTSESVVGAQVRCTDGIGGRVTQVIVNPVSQKVTDLVVKEDRWPQTRRMVPVKWVAKAKGRVIRLRCSRDELAKMGPFVEIGAYKKRNLPHQPSLHRNAAQRDKQPRGPRVKEPAMRAINKEAET
jgi:hypothetical protein